MHARCWQLYRRSAIGHCPFSLLVPAPESSLNHPDCKHT
jgi:hypothetical protein